MVLFPVILPIVETGDKLSRKERATCLSMVSRGALELSAEKSGVMLGELRKDQNGIPRPFDGNYWSLSHKPKYVAAVVSNERIGIDIEEMKPRSESLFSRVATDGEWRLSTDKSWDAFFRYWTAKEATLKAVGVGISELRACQVVSVPDDNHIILKHQDCVFRIEQLRYKNHIVSVLKDNNEIEWIVAGE